MTDTCMFLISDGKRTEAYSRQPGGAGILKGVSVCRDGDKPQLIVGAIIALCKSLGSNPIDAALAVLRAYSVELVEAKKAGVKKSKQPKVQVVRRPDPVTPQPGEIIGLISTKRGHCEMTMAPDLDFNIRSMGRVGNLTKFKDFEGKPLMTGDLVIVECEDGNTRRGKVWSAIPGLHFVVDEDSDDTATKGQYIMGMCGGCNAKTGEIDSRFRVRLAKKWYEVELGEEHDLVRTVWKGVKA